MVILSWSENYILYSSETLKIVGEESEKQILLSFLLLNSFSALPAGYFAALNLTIPQLQTDQRI